MINELFPYSVMIAGVIALVKFKQINKNFHPFLYILWLASINEIVTEILFRNGYANFINSNVYCLFESMLYLWFFRNIGVLNKLQKIYYILLIAFIALWIVDNFWINNIRTTYNSYFSIAYALTLVLLSIHAINEILIKEREIIRDPSFWICIGVIIFYTYSILIEVFWLYGLGTSIAFSGEVYVILSWVNLLCNLIFAVAILWIRKKQAFTLQF